MSCVACLYFRQKEKLNCDKKPLPKNMRFCTELALEKFKEICPEEGNALEMRQTSIIKNSWGPNDANFE